MSVPASDKNQVLAALRGPLSFAAKDDFKNLPRIVGLGKTLAGIARAHAAQLPELSELASLAEKIDTVSLPERRRAIVALLERLDKPKDKPATALVLPTTMRPPKPAAPPPKQSTLSPASPLESLKGVGEKVAQALGERGLHTLRDLLYFLPRRYEDWRKRASIRDAQIGERVTVVGTVRALGPVPMRGGRRMFEMALVDDTGLVRLKWFHFHQSYFQRFAVGTLVQASGVVEAYQGQKQMLHPDVQPASEQAPLGSPIVGIYSEIPGVHAKKVRALIEQALPAASALPDALADLSLGLPRLEEALLQVHLPEADADLALLDRGRSKAHERLIIEELLVLQLGMVQRRLHTQHEAALRIEGDAVAIAKALFPFVLTQAQARVSQEIFADLASGRPMHRLVQGDVGAGKTAVAFIAMRAAVASGQQAALMAPTELLAEQHFKNAVKALHPEGVRVGFLSSSVPAGQARDTLGKLAAGAIDVLIGTHALIQERVEFARLALAIVDEQHRFGVTQRAELRKKGTLAPHLLVMTATPIPRTLALTLYGDLDVSIIDELPPGRTPIKTDLVREAGRGKLYARLRAELQNGRQAYVVYPLVEESEKVDLKDATQMSEALRAEFVGFEVALLHGRMSAEEKQSVMRRFSIGEVKLLVATTVIEVGIDVPNATTMVIEHAERFGLSQLHQLRGRVGRGAEQSYCYLVTGGAGQEAYERLRVLCNTNDGFLIAEEDLKIRGPGDFIGTRQAGLPELGVSNLVRDQDLLAEARRLAEKILAASPDLSRHPLLRAAVSETFARVEHLARAG